MDRVERSLTDLRIGLIDARETVTARIIAASRSIGLAMFVCTSGKNIEMRLPAWPNSTSSRTLAVLLLKSQKLIDD